MAGRGLLIVVNSLDSLKPPFHMNANNKTPFPVIAAQSLLGLILFFYILFIARDIIVPIIYAAILAILLNPLVNLCERYGINRVLSIFIAVIVMLLVAGGLVYFIVNQSLRFGDTLPALQHKLNIFLNDLGVWVSKTFKVGSDKVNEWVTNTRNKQLNSVTAILGETLITATNILKVVFLIPVYVFMFLFYKPLLLEFFTRAFRKENHEMVNEVLFETKTLIQSYLLGLLIEAAIIAALNSTGLLLLGVDYAILLGIIGALLNIIPYIGGIVATLLPMIIAYTSKPPIYVIWVLALYMTVQFIDNHYIVPKIVASKVRINALVSIVVVFIGGALWGVGGMFLSIPLTAIVKVIFDRITPMKPWGFLLGDTMPPIRKTIFKSSHQSKLEEQKSREAMDNSSK
jgi:predicted PurR-regulated permease PerM